jgi:hypothetical protein
MSFGPDLVDSYRRAANHVDIKILKGANPADLPWSSPPSSTLEWLGWSDSSRTRA